MVWGWASRGVSGVLVAISFGAGELEHEGLKGRVNGIGHRLFGRGFEAVVECFEMRFDVMNIIGCCLSGYC